MFPNSSVFMVVSLGFVVFLPLAMGFVTVFIVDRRRPQPLWIWFLLPWIPLAAGEAAAMIVAWEGLICIVMFTPIGMGASSLGGVAAGLIARYATSRRSKNASVVCVMFLPLLVSPFEQRFHAQVELRRIETVIDIQASPDVVWRNIERVSRINLRSCGRHGAGVSDFPILWRQRCRTRARVECATLPLTVVSCSLRRSIYGSHSDGSHSR